MKQTSNHLAQMYTADTLIRLSENQTNCECLRQAESNIDVDQDGGARITPKVENKHQVPRYRVPNAPGRACTTIQAAFRFYLSYSNIRRGMSSTFRTPEILELPRTTEQKNHALGVTAQARPPVRSGSQGGSKLSKTSESLLAVDS